MRPDGIHSEFWGFSVFSSVQLGMKPNNKKKIKGIRTKFSNRLLELNHGIFLIYETIFFRIARGLVYLVVFKPSQIYVGF